MRDQQCNMVIADGSMNMNVNKVIESSRNWKLANDVELLKRLEKFSENIISNASLTLKSMDNLEDSLNETFLRVRTVANKFQAIADNQFIENRVQEEEEFVLASENKKDSDDTQVSPETSKAQLLESIRECQNALSKKFETVQLSGIDSEDEMATSSPVVLVPKNVYKERRLPHLIGGEQFISDETLGLMTNSGNADDSIESDEDMDETDRSSYYSNSFKKSADDQAETAISSLSSSALQEHVVRGSSPLGNFDSKVSFEDNLESAIEDDRVQPAVSNVPVLRGFLLDSHGSMFDENNGLFAEKNSLFDERNEFPENNYDSKPPETPKTELPSSSSPSIAASRDKLLAGRNFASFKEDLARVLSNAAPNKKVGTPDSIGAKSSSKNNNVSTAKSSEDEVEEEDDVLPSPMSVNSLSTPESSSLPLSGPAKQLDSQVAHGENIGPVTLPNVCTNTLENLAKGRPKLKGHRRPPSRKHRQGSSRETDSTANANPSNSVHSDDASIQESASTQPGSNILSPATDEEDLFVLPAFDLPTDPPSGGLFFNNTLLSPGATIDDGGLSTSPLFPPSSTLPNAQVDTPERTLPVIESVQSVTQLPPRNEIPRLDNIQERSGKTVFDPLSDSPTDLFSSEPLLASSWKKEDSAGSATDLFPPISSSKTLLPSEDDDIFSSKSRVRSTKTSSSPLKKPESSPEASLFSSTNVTAPPLSPSSSLFNDWTAPGNEVKSGTKTKSSIKSGLQWDLLGSDDFGEDLFRSSKNENRQRPKDKEPKLMEPDLVDASETKRKNIFSPTDFEKSKDGMFFEDDAFSSSDIFSDSSAFMRLSLPSNTKDSLFASDDDDDDDSLFKTSKKPGSDSSTKLSEKAEKKNSIKSSSDPSSRDVMKDPLMSMDDVE